MERGRSGCADRGDLRLSGGGHRARPEAFPDISIRLLPRQCLTAQLRTDSAVVYPDRSGQGI
jgi:hypothetical protein